MRRKPSHAAYGELDSKLDLVCAAGKMGVMQADPLKASEHLVPKRASA
jgi:hypothetical protein